MIKLISLLKNLHNFYKKSKYLQGIFGFLFLIRNQKYLKYFYYLIKWTINLIGWFVSTIAIIFTDPLQAIELAVDWISNSFNLIILYIQNLFYWIGDSISKLTKNVNKDDSPDDYYPEPAYINSPSEDESNNLTEDRSSSNKWKYVTIGILTGISIGLIYYYFNKTDDPSNLGGYLDSFNHW